MNRTKTPRTGPARTHATRITTAATATALLTLLALSTTACSESDVDKAKDRAASATAKAGEAVSSATEAASSKMAEVKDGVDAKGDVKVDGPTKSEDDRTTAAITATNPKDKKADYTISVNFRDGDGNLLDTAVLNITDVEPGKSKSGTARSNRSLSGTPKAEISKALRH
ncbi:FxLYD domain-containing protein [Streptomyces sp. NPDC050439]|uniref:FxLYD domain-containing protein n=1 Tax=unclassified Streptomyces TaxID=2593676 RepID=UPI0034344D7A